MSMDGRTSNRRFGAKQYQTQPYNAYEAAAAGETTYDDGSGDTEYNQAGRQMLNETPPQQGRPGRDSIFSQKSLERQGNTSGTAPFTKVYAETPLGDPNERSSTVLGINKAEYDLDTAMKVYKDVDFRLNDIKAQKTALRAQFNARKGTVAVNDFELAQESPVYTGLKQEEKELKMSKEDLGSIIREKESQITVGALRYGSGGGKSQLVKEFEYDVKSIKDVNPMDKIAKNRADTGGVKSAFNRGTTGNMTDPKFDSNSVSVDQNSIDRGNILAKTDLLFNTVKFTESFLPAAYASGLQPEPNNKVEKQGDDYLKSLQVFASDMYTGVTRTAQDIVDLPSTPFMFSGSVSSADPDIRYTHKETGKTITFEEAKQKAVNDPKFGTDYNAGMWVERDTENRFKTDYTKGMGFPTLPGMEGTPQERSGLDPHGVGDPAKSSMFTNYSSWLIQTGADVMTGGKNQITQGLKLHQIHKIASERGAVDVGADLLTGIASVVAPIPTAQKLKLGATFMKNMPSQVSSGLKQTSSFQKLIKNNIGKAGNFAKNTMKITKGNKNKKPYSNLSPQGASNLYRGDTPIFRFTEKINLHPGTSAYGTMKVDQIGYNVAGAPYMKPPIITPGSSAIAKTNEKHFFIQGTAMMRKDLKKNPKLMHPQPAVEIMFGLPQPDMGWKTLSTKMKSRRFRRQMNTVGMAVGGAGAVGFGMNPQEAYAFPVGAGVRQGIKGLNQINSFFRFAPDMGKVSQGSLRITEKQVNALKKLGVPVAQIPASRGEAGALIRRLNAQKVTARKNKQSIPSPQTESDWFNMGYYTQSGYRGSFP